MRVRQHVSRLCSLDVHTHTTLSLCGQQGGKQKMTINIVGKGCGKGGFEKQPVGMLPSPRHITRGGGWG